MPPGPRLQPGHMLVGVCLHKGTLVRASRDARNASDAAACYRACEKIKGCAAFTFITSASPTAPKSKCWLKKEGFAAGAEYSAGTMSGVVRRVG